jgi:integrase
MMAGSVGRVPSGCARTTLGRAPPLATSRILGHASVAFTHSVYQHADDEMVELAARRLEEAFGG